MNTNNWYSVGVERRSSKDKASIDYGKINPVEYRKKKKKYCTINVTRDKRRKIEQSRDIDEGT